MKKKEIKISNEGVMELMGLKRTSNSDDKSDKTAIDLAIEKYTVKIEVQQKISPCSRV